MTSMLMPASCGVHGPGEIRMSVGMQRFDFVDGCLIVAANDNFISQLADVLDEVVGERIVII